MCAKYSDFLCIWLRKYDYLTGKVRYWSDPDPKLFIPDPDPAKSSGSDRIRIRIRIHNTAVHTNNFFKQFVKTQMQQEITF